VLRSLGKNTSTIQRVVNDLSNGRCVGVDIHAVARSKMTKDALGRDFQRPTGQLRIATSLDMIYSLNPLIERQVSIKSHD
jgi:hypothetical protein